LENICEYAKNKIINNYTELRKINHYLKIIDFNNNIWYIEYNNRGNLEEFTININNYDKVLYSCLFP